jgi:hypothetical protein
MGIQAEQARADMEVALESVQSEVKQLVNFNCLLQPSTICHITFHDSYVVSVEKCKLSYL